MAARRTLTLAGAVAATVVVAACSGTPAPVVGSGGTTSGASPTAATSSRPAPRVVESNPPGDIPDNQAYVAFSPAVGGYWLKAPEGWARTSAGTEVSFTDKLNSIEVSSSRASSRPTIASVTNTEVPLLRAKVPVFALGKVSLVVRHAGTAILLTYRGDSAPNQVTGKVVRRAFERYTFYRAGRRADLTVSGATNADNVDPWRIVSDSLRWR